MSEKKRELVTNVLRKFNDVGIRYALLRSSIDYQIIEIQDWADIDILVHPDNRDKAHNILRENGFIVDPRLNRHTYLYGVAPFRYYRSFSAKIAIDVVYQLTCKSLNDGEICPLHKEIQEKAFQNDADKYEVIKKLPKAVEVVYEFTYTLFNKNGNEEKLRDIYKKVEQVQDKDKDELEYMLGLVYFRFAPVIIDKFKNKEVANIKQDYLKFKDY